MSMSLLAFALSYLGMLLLCLTMNRHRAALLRGDLRLPTTPVMRLLAMGCFGFAGWLCIGSQGAEIGTVVWLCLTMLAGVLLALLQAWQARWAVPLAPLLTLGARCRQSSESFGVQWRACVCTPARLS